jgi:hypothetical protein
MFSLDGEWLPQMSAQAFMIAEVDRRVNVRGDHAVLITPCWSRHAPSSRSYRPELPIPCIAKARHNIAGVVQPLVDRSRHNPHRQAGLRQPGQSLRGGERTDRRSMAYTIDPPVASIGSKA